MKFPLLSALAAAMLIASIIPSHADNTTALRAQLTKNYASISSDFAAHNIDGMAAFLAPEFTVKALGQPQSSRAQCIAAFKQQMMMTQNPVWKRTILSLSMNDGDAIVIVAGHLTAKVLGQDKKTHDFALNAKSQDTWTTVDDKWELSKSHVMSMTALMDGHPISRH